MTAAPSRLVRSRALLQRSWSIVRASGLNSLSEETVRKTKEFDANSLNHIERIAKKLRNGKFSFSDEIGVAPLKRSGNGRRPIVVAPIENRVVRRAILEVLQGYELISDEKRRNFHGVDAIRKVMKTPTSVGGIAKRRVPYGLALIDSAVRDGHHWFVRSDIKDFFTRIPLADVNHFVRTAVNDEFFSDLFFQALKTNLANKEALQERKHFVLFPSDDTGVAQGSALSALAGNIILHDFDIEMNNRGIVCVRYIDDFILLGKSEKAVTAAFRSAQNRLLRLGMSVYDFTDEAARKAGKVDSGNIHNGTDVLGYRISAHALQPSRSAKRALFDKLDKIILEAERNMTSAASGRSHSHTRLYHHALSLMHRTIWGWSQAFKHANVPHVLQQLDAQIDQRILMLQDKTRELTRCASPLVKRRVTGIHLLQDTHGHPLPEIDEPYCKQSSDSLRAEPY
ncbi:RNA-directed DNA polymerase [Bradyrhizobium sp. USDA 4369]